jgi:hypothetical protein
MRVWVIASVCSVMSAVVSVATSWALMRHEFDKTKPEIEDLKTDLGALHVAHLDLAEKLEHPATPSDDKPAWWCIDHGNSACDRTTEGCERTRAYVGRKREAGACEGRHVAYCGGMKGANCFGTLSLCESATTDLFKSPDREVWKDVSMCIGVQ